MIWIVRQKIKCWLKGHDYEPMCDYCRRLSKKINKPTWCSLSNINCHKNYDGKLMRCIHCGKIKR